jgi:hypothetical protein
MTVSCKPIGRHCEHSDQRFALSSTGSAKQSRKPLKQELDCFVACAPRNDDQLKHREILQQRYDADNDDDDARDLPGASVERQHVDEIENENNDKKRDENADQHRQPPVMIVLSADSKMRLHPLQRLDRDLSSGEEPVAEVCLNVAAICKNNRFVPDG